MTPDTTDPLGASDRARSAPATLVPAMRLAAAALLAAAAALLFAPAAVDAQIPVRDGPLPPELEQHVIELSNAPSTLRLPGRTSLPTGSEVRGDVVVLGGGLRLGGTIVGELVVVNGDLALEPGARIEGAVRVLGGRVTGQEGASLPSDIQVFAAPLRYRIRGDRVEGIGEGGVVPSRFLESDLGFGRSRFTLRADGAYNRVEGLPVLFGPVFETSGRNPLVLNAFGIWRSASGLSIDTGRMGYDVSLVQSMGGRGTIEVGLGAFRRVHPIETRGMSDLESSLATFFMRRDYRDHYHSEGWDATLTLRPIEFPVRLSLGFSEEEHEFARIEGPWTLGDGERAWRLQPQVGEGRARFARANLELDSRDDPRDPSDGWWLSVEGTQQLGGWLELPGSPLFPDDGEGSGEPMYTFRRVTHGAVDLRRYARVSASSTLRLRLYMAGTPRGDPLPPQFQGALGGEGSLPGHPRFSIDCGARTGLLAFTLPPEARQAYTAYGCDRVRLAQIEVQRTLPFVWDPLPDGWGDPELAGLSRVQPSVSVFLNSGDGKVRRNDVFPDRASTSQRTDLGLGLTAGPLGIYWAYPLNERDRALNFFVRLDHRF
jgi:hypothetical protein